MYRLAHIIHGGTNSRRKEEERQDILQNGMHRADVEIQDQSGGAPMRRLVELIAALTASTIGLIGVSSEARTMAYPYDNAQVASFPSAVNTWTTMSSQVDHFLIVLALLLLGLSVGAYLHAVYQSTSGLALLWISALSLTIAVGSAALAPPSFAYTGGATSSAALDVVPTALPVITVVTALVAAVAAITPARPLVDSATTSGRLHKFNQKVRLH
jgi:hypothetical protein